ncbi:MAG: PD-(D/E)XK nuclease family protein [Terracidiphilus sp.]
MNRELSSEIDAWLRGGGLVVTASERAARSLTQAFHRARRAEGLTAWQAPDIQDWQTFIRDAWDERDFDSRVVLNSLQEQSLWAGIVSAAAPEAARVADARERLAALAMEAHGLICAYAPQLLNKKARSAWDQDAAAFSEWLAQFDAICGAGGLISPARLPLELIAALKQDSAGRSPLLLAGFDRILPTQQELFVVWGDCTPVSPGQTAAQIEFHQAADLVSELAACAIWSKRQLAVNPHARLLVVTQDVPRRRGEIERAFLRFVLEGTNASAPSSVFEFSLGVSLGQIALARGAGLLLHWLAEPIEEHELDWLLSTGQMAASPAESLALTAFMRALRRKDLQRTRWTLAEFLRQKPGAELPAAWVARITQVQRRLQEFARRPQSLLAWAELAPRLLELAGWPGGRPLTSAEFQAHRRLQQTVDDCASLGFDGRSIEWREFLALLDRAVSETLFAPESEDSPILIAGPAESAGLTADAIWFLGATEQAWPASGATHPLLPPSVQRAAGMPHASPRLDWELAGAVTRRLLASAAEVHFSFARQSEGVEARPSRIVEQIACAPLPLRAELAAPAALPPLAAPFRDSTRVPFPPGDAPGGASTLTAQSQCAFKAFATARLDADCWDPAEAGLTAKERGQLLHEVLHSIWAGPPRGIRSHAELVALPDLRSFVSVHVRGAIQTAMPIRARESMPQRYLALEEARLLNLVTEWLEYERTRVPFTVLDTEQKTSVSVAGLPLRVRLDRVDRLINHSLLVIDYKSGNPTPNSWDLPRPDDVQLPLYSTFAFPGDANEIGGLVFAKVRAGEPEFTGKIRDAKATLRANLRGNTNLVKRALDSDQLFAWKNYIEELALAFLAGRSVVNPRAYPDTCEYCGLQSLCRINENPPLTNNNNEEAPDA